MTSHEERHSHLNPSLQLVFLFVPILTQLTATARATARARVTARVKVEALLIQRVKRSFNEYVLIFFQMMESFNALS
jgi:hypothetical protein